MDVDFEVNKLAQKDINEQLLIALEQTASEMLNDLIQSQTMPFDTGTMQNAQTEVTQLDRENKEIDIMTSTPYARRLYYHPEYNFQKGKNPNAGGRWWDPYISGSKSGIHRELFEKLARKRLKKYDS